MRALLLAISSLTMAVYRGPVLTACHELPTWKPAFLAAATMRGLDAYFTTPDYRDPTLADRISAATMDAFTVTADSRLLEVSLDLRRAERREAEKRRASLRDEYVQKSVDRACTVLYANEMLAAVQLLFAAVDSAISSELLHGAGGPYEMWGRLCTLVSSPESLAVGLCGMFALRVQDGEAPRTFFARLEASTEQYAQSLLCHSFGKARCSADPRFEANVMDLTKVLMFARAWPVDVTGSFEQTKPLSYELLKQRMMAHLDGAYCFYCHSKEHVDAFCYNLAQARQKRTVRAGYVLPSGSTYPSMSDASRLQITTRRFCTTCQSTRHRDDDCPNRDNGLAMDAPSHGSPGVIKEEDGVVREDAKHAQDTDAAASPHAHDRTPERDWYEGPVLTDMADFPQWKPAFLARAALHCYVEFYTLVDAQANPKLVTPAELREVHASARDAEPQAPSEATIADHDMRVRRRLRHMRGLLHAKYAAKTYEVGEEAAAYLRSAVDGALHGHFEDASSPFEMWQALFGSYCISPDGTKAALLEHLAAMTYSPRCKAALFLQRLEAAVARYATFALPPMSSTHAALYHSVVDSLKMSFLVRALQCHLRSDLALWLADVPSGDFAHLQCCLLTHAATLPDTNAEEDVMLVSPAATMLAAAYEATMQEDSLASPLHPVERRSVYLALQPENADATTSLPPMQLSRTSTPPLQEAADRGSPEVLLSSVAAATKDAISKRREDDESRSRTTCTYCHGTQHVDAACKRLAQAVRDTIVRSDYDLPYGMTFPELGSDNLVEEDRRFCTYCQSTRHYDNKCPMRAKHKKTKCLRRGYVAPTKPNNERQRTEPAPSTLPLTTTKKRLRANSSDGDGVACNEIWSTDETAALERLVQTHGQDWDRVLTAGHHDKTLLPSRTTDSVRTRMRWLERQGRGSIADAGDVGTYSYDVPHVTI
ncbi:hypothetical protein SDRG_10142 [Saprolegnia diclina VS20]|uniref:CCHC-type domain-containing protein n=1 Tax=Saprolegnia diclina (strain VS20) TaxID=1156394 RepID=T0Q3J3_SAPDV|nr:hypothetical protein SDRG_10142 [Saprolegnia diclina VS20]EQC32399.1 hypothetical protein SDRG_10142 [Saprolegnia diclina VS20]|eukprot:XP_008614340.1 hypothetical protein SDRG_10142 [Saprolegnia diclina VS20]